MLRARNIIGVKTEDEFDKEVDSTPTLCLHTSIEDSISKFITSEMKGFVEFTETFYEAVNVDLRCGSDSIIVSKSKELINLSGAKMDNLRRVIREVIRYVTPINMLLVNVCDKHIASRIISEKGDDAFYSIFAYGANVKISIESIVSEVLYPLYDKVIKHHFQYPDNYIIDVHNAVQRYLNGDADDTKLSLRFDCGFVIPFGSSQKTKQNGYGIAGNIGLNGEDYSRFSYVIRPNDASFNDAVQDYPKKILGGFYDAFSTLKGITDRGDFSKLTSVSRFFELNEDLSKYEDQFPIIEYNIYEQKANNPFFGYIQSNGLKSYSWVIPILPTFITDEDLFIDIEDIKSQINILIDRSTKNAMKDNWDSLKRSLYSKMRRVFPPKDLIIGVHRLQGFDGFIPIVFHIEYDQFIFNSSKDKAKRTPCDAGFFNQSTCMNMTIKIAL